MYEELLQWLQGGFVAAIEKAFVYFQGFETGQVVQSPASSFQLSNGVGITLSATFQKKSSGDPITLNTEYLFNLILQNAQPLFSGQPVKLPAFTIPFQGQYCEVVITAQLDFTTMQPSGEPAVAGAANPPPQLPTLAAPQHAAVPPQVAPQPPNLAALNRDFPPAGAPSPASMGAAAFRG